MLPSVVAKHPHHHSWLVASLLQQRRVMRCKAIAVAMQSGTYIVCSASAPQLRARAAAGRSGQRGARPPPPFPKPSRPLDAGHPPLPAWARPRPPWRRSRAATAGPASQAARQSPGSHQAGSRQRPGSDQAAARQSSGSGQAGHLVRSSQPRTRRSPRGRSRSCSSRTAGSQSTSTRSSAMLRPPATAPPMVP